eukprot:6149463-Amphidinium_carterae.3
MLHLETGEVCPHPSSTVHNNRGSHSAVVQLAYSWWSFDASMGEGRMHLVCINWLAWRRPCIPSAKLPETPSEAP